MKVEHNLYTALQTFDVGVFILRIITICQIVDRFTGCLAEAA